MASQPNLTACAPRYDGWTVERQQAFLKVLADCGCVTHAARAVGMSKQFVRKLRRCARFSGSLACARVGP
jgi:molybdenum-dependent DNA-binding transcriptional regulator ModE